MALDGATRVGPYNILSTLGRGGMGIVYVAVHQESGVKVALKTLYGTGAHNLDRLQREIESLKHLDHSGVIEVFDHGIDDGQPWYAMAILEGRSLGDHFHSDKLPTPATVLMRPARTVSSSEIPSQDEASEENNDEREVIKHLSPRQITLLGYIGQVCRALAYIHGEGTVHCDLKPDNIFITQEGKAVLVDFGIAARTPTRLDQDAMERAGILAGTYHYLSPERIEGREFDARADLYALGCVLYQIVTGKRLFESSEDDRLLVRHLKENPVPPSALGWVIPNRLETLIMRLVAKRPQDRPGHALAVLHELQQLEGIWIPPPKITDPTPTPYLYKPALSGRDELLASLQSHIDDTLDGKMAVAILSGESGVGKTRLAVELIQLARMRQMVVLVGQAAAPALDHKGRALMNALPLSLFQRPMDEVARHASRRNDQAMLDGLRASAAILSPLVPAFDALFPDLTPTLASAGPEGEAQLAGAIANALDLLRGEHPLMLALDDLQWADAMSLQVLACLMESNKDRGWCLLGLVRPEEAPATVRRLMAHKTIKTYRVPRLDRAAVGTLSAQMLGTEEVPRALAAKLHSQTRGNPFFVAEILMMALEKGLLSLDEAGVWRLNEESGPRALERMAQLQLPESVQSLLVGRLDGLPPTARQLSEAASIMGKQTELAPLIVLSGFDESVFQRSLQALRRRGILEDADEGMVRFVHDKIREVAYGKTAPARRRDLHLKAAEYMSQHARAEEAGELAWHWEQSGDESAARQLYLDAAVRAARRYAYTDAERFFDRALALTIPGEAAHHEISLIRAKNVLMMQGMTPEAEALLEGVMQSTSAPEQLSVRCRCAVLLGRLLVRTGRGVDARSMLEEAYQNAQVLGDRLSEGEALNALASVHLRLGHLDESLDMLNRSADIAREVGNRADEALALSNAGIVYFHRCIYDKASEYCLISLEIRRELGDLRGESDSLTNLAIIHIAESRMGLAIDAFEKALALKKSVRDLRGESIVLNNLAVLQHQQGRRPQAYAYLTLALDIERRINDFHATANTLINLASICTEQRRFDEARAYLDEALTLSRSYDDKRTESYALDTLGLLLRDSDSEEAEETFQMALAMSYDLDDKKLSANCHLHLATLYRFLGRADAASESLAASREIFESLSDARCLVLCECEAGHQALVAGGDAKAELAKARHHTAPLGETAPGGMVALAIWALEQSVERKARGGRLLRGQCAEDLPTAVERRVRRE